MREQWARRSHRHPHHHYLHRIHDLNRRSTPGCYCCPALTVNLPAQMPEPLHPPIHLGVITRRIGFHTHRRHRSSRGQSHLAAADAAGNPPHRRRCSRREASRPSAASLCEIPHSIAQVSLRHDCQQIHRCFSGGSSSSRSSEVCLPEKSKAGCFGSSAMTDPHADCRLSLASAAAVAAALRFFIEAYTWLTMHLLSCYDERASRLPGHHPHHVHNNHYHC